MKSGSGAKPLDNVRATDRNRRSQEAAHALVQEPEDQVQTTSKSGSKEDASERKEVKDAVRSGRARPS